MAKHHLEHFRDVLLEARAKTIPTREIRIRDFRCDFKDFLTSLNDINAILSSEQSDSEITLQPSSYVASLDKLEILLRIERLGLLSRDLQLFYQYGMLHCADREFLQLAHDRKAIWNSDEQQDLIVKMSSFIGSHLTRQ